MTKAEFLARIYHRVGAKRGLTQKQTAAIVDALFATLADEFIGRARCYRRLRQTPNGASSRFWWPEFGTFALVKRAERRVGHPRSGKQLTIPARFTIRFKPAAVVKQLLNRDR